MTNQEQDLLEAFAIVRAHLNALAGMMDPGIFANGKELADQVARLSYAVNKYAALPALPLPKQQAEAA